MLQTLAIIVIVLSRRIGKYYIRNYTVESEMKRQCSLTVAQMPAFADERRWHTYFRLFYQNGYKATAIVCHMRRHVRKLGFRTCRLET